MSLGESGWQVRLSLGIIADSCTLGLSIPASTVLQVLSGLYTRCIFMFCYYSLYNPDLRQSIRKSSLTCSWDPIHELAGLLPVIF